MTRRDKIARTREIASLFGARPTGTAGQFRARCTACDYAREDGEPRDTLSIGTGRSKVLLHCHYGGNRIDGGECTEKAIVDNIWGGRRAVHLSWWPDGVEHPLTVDDLYYDPHKRGDERKVPPLDEVLRGVGRMTPHYSRLSAVLGGANPATLFARLYWHSVNKAHPVDGPGWFWLPVKWLREETGWTDNQILYATRKLRELRAIRWRPEKFSHRNWYRLYLDRVQGLLDVAETGNPEPRRREIPISRTREIPTQNFPGRTGEATRNFPGRNRSDREFSGSLRRETEEEREKVSKRARSLRSEAQVLPPLGN